MKLLKVSKVSSSTLGDLPLAGGEQTFRPSGYKREEKTAEQHAHIGYTETPQGAELSLTLNASLDPDAVAQLGEDNLTIFAGVSVYQMAKAWLEEPPQLEQGTFKAVFRCNQSQKIS